MISSYSEFIFESHLMVNESKIVYSNELRNVFKKLDHRFSKILLDMEAREIDTKNNYFDISMKPDTNDMLSFSTDKKVRELLDKEGVTAETVIYTGKGGVLKHSDSNKHIFDKLGYTYEEGSSAYRPGQGENGFILDRAYSEESDNIFAHVIFNPGEPNEKEGVYNLKNLKILKNLSPIWSKNRQDIYVGKAVRGLLSSRGETFKDIELENFVNIFKSGVSTDLKDLFKLVKGDEIAYWYNEDNYYIDEDEDRVGGTLGESCMRSADDSYFDIYCKNPEVCQLLILFSSVDTQKIVGRALVWKLNTGNMFMDRVYYTEDYINSLFSDYAKQNNIFKKEINNSHGNTKSISPSSGSIAYPGNTVDLTSGIIYYDYYPYLDTFKYFYPNLSTLSTIFDRSDESYELEDINGGTSDHNYGCEYCGGSGEEECGYCGGSGNEECSYCEGDGYTIDADNNREDCRYCDAEGKIECGNCRGNGTVSCDYC
jgi:hypothetical protein